LKSINHTWRAGAKFQVASGGDAAVDIAAWSEHLRDASGAFSKHQSPRKIFGWARPSFQSRQLTNHPITIIDFRVANSGPASNDRQSASTS